ncbi:probable WRKY transcription factor 50 [Abrus precatorius]|uniref:Probable WRKY transcription factor 50 n=1 Tax=Abrus precatorius TaxID=3816 RepID=A0A8B8JZJ5_ABRPR|nr:probable WRKY transcription factor 50 [Abrus precatorius]
MDYYFGNPNPNPCNRHSAVLNMASPFSEFMLSDYLMLDDVVDHQESWSQSTETESSEKAASSDARHGDATSTTTNMQVKCKNSGIRRKKVEVSQRVTFRTRSQLENMDDGYKWRKYGKKSVKNTPYPRNYYKCSGEGCDVKKRVERDREDSSYVLTTYDGVHNHETPSTAYYSQMSLMHSSDWALQPSVNSSSIS